MADAPSVQGGVAFRALALFGLGGTSHGGLAHPFYCYDAIGYLLGAGLFFPSFSPPAPFLLWNMGRMADKKPLLGFSMVFVFYASGWTCFSPPGIISGPTHFFCS
jgi:hypothetical protein